MSVDVCILEKTLDALIFVAINVAELISFRLAVVPVPETNLKLLLDILVVCTFPVVIIPVAETVLTIISLVFNDPALILVANTFVIVPLLEPTASASTFVPINETVVTLSFMRKLLPVIFPNCTLFIVELNAFKLPVEMFVEITVGAVILVAFNVDADTLSNLASVEFNKGAVTELVARMVSPVTAVAKTVPVLELSIFKFVIVEDKAVTVPVVTFVPVKLVVDTPVRARNVPFTSNLYDGAVVPIPTLPLVVYIDPTVLLSPTAVKDVVNTALDEEMFVFLIFVAVIPPTAIILAPTFKSPDKLIDPPVIVVDDTYEEDNVLNVPLPLA